LCRNVLIYFDQDLQGRVLSLFHGSLVNFGFLALVARRLCAWGRPARSSSPSCAKRKYIEEWGHEPLRRAGGGRHLVGRLHALEVLFSSLPNDFDVPIAVVQHRRPTPTRPSRSFSSSIRRCTWRRPRQGAIVRGRVYLAPPDYHLLVDGAPEAGGAFALSTDLPVRFSRPSIDVLFESAADAFQHRLIGIVLTGKNDDGARGLCASKSVVASRLSKTRSAEGVEMPKGHRSIQGRPRPAARTDRPFLQGSGEAFAAEAGEAQRGTQEVTQRTSKKNLQKNQEKNRRETTPIAPSARFDRDATLNVWIEGDKANNVSGVGLDRGSFS